MATENRVLIALQCRELASERGGAVVIREAVSDEFFGLEEQKQARLLRIMELWCGNHRLTPEQFNGNEGRERRGNSNVLLQAFKTHKVRLYGTALTLEGRRTFAIVDVDGAKKQNKADPNILKRAKQRALDLLEELEKLKKVTEGR
jgi:hypothetical protein